MRPEVLEAMRSAASAFVKIEELQEAAGAVIAESTGAEAGYVTSGAAAGIALGVAACMVGLDISRMARLPDTTGMPDHVVIQKPHRNDYDHAFRSTGATLVEVGFAGRVQPWELEEAITERTAAVAYAVSEARGALPHSQVVEIAHRHGVPVVVDAAAALPPDSNLRRFIAEGADLVAFSGGKALRGPQASGILAGRKDLIQSVALQHQDMDVRPESWSYRQRYLDTGILPGVPYHGIGRTMKVGKEEIAGLVVALRLYLARDEAAEQAEWESKVVSMVEGVRGIPGVAARRAVMPGSKGRVPVAEVALDEEALGVTVWEVVNRLQERNPRILLRESQADHGILIFHPLSLQEGEEEIIVARLREILAAGRAEKGIEGGASDADRPELRHGRDFGAYKIGNDEEMFKCISSANIACGFHGGDPMVMDRSVKLAVEHGVQVGCHPSYPDLMGFGRRVLACSSAETESYVLYQLGALWAFAKAHKAEVRHFKAHGALSNVAMKDMEVARAIARGVARFSKEVVLVSSVGSQQVVATEEMGLRPAINVSTDRAFNTDGTPVSRKLPGAVIHDPKVIVERAVQMVRDGTVTAITGETVKIRVDTIAIHGDNPAGLQAAIDLVQALKAAGVQIRPLAEIL